MVIAETRIRMILRKTPLKVFCNLNACINKSIAEKFAQNVPLGLSIESEMSNHCLYTVSFRKPAKLKRSLRQHHNGMGLYRVLEAVSRKMTSIWC